MGAGLFMSGKTNSISSIHSTKSVSKRTDIRMTTLETMRKNYKDDEDIMNKLTNGMEMVLDFDRTWNGKYEFLRCAECNGPLLGHRAEKCRQEGDGYDEALVKKFETGFRGNAKFRDIVLKHINNQKIEDMTLRLDKEAEIAKKMPAKTNLMVGRTEIPKWIGQEFEVWRKEMEKWHENDKSTEETNYCNVMESLKKNDKIKDYVVTTLAEKTEDNRKVTAILEVMAEKYERTESERCLELMKQIVNFKVDGEIESITDRFERMMAETKKVYLATYLEYALTLQFMDRLEKEGKISSDERMRLKDEIETKEGKSKVRNSAEIVQKELRRMKVINNREKVFDKTIEAHYVRDNSRYGRWKNQMERNGNKRSDSRRGFWRNGAAASNQRYIKDRNGSKFRSQSGRRGFCGYNRSKSGNGDRY